MKKQSATQLRLFHAAGQGGKSGKPIQRLTARQSELIEHCLDYTFLYLEDFASKNYSRRSVGMLTKMGILDYHPPTQYDEVCWDLSDDAFRRLWSGELTLTPKLK